MTDGREGVAARGTTPDGGHWTLLYRPDGVGGRHHVSLVVDGAVADEASGFDVPGTTEIGFAGGLTPGRGSFYLFGIVTSRIRVVRAEGRDEHDRTDVTTTPLPRTRPSPDDGADLRSFVLVRPPVDDVTALVGLDRDGRPVQRIPLVRPPDETVGEGS